MNIVLSLIVAGIMVGTLYGLMGFTLTLMFRSTGVLSFAHAGFALIAWPPGREPVRHRAAASRGRDGQRAADHHADRDGRAVS